MSLIPDEAVFSVGEYLDLLNGLLQPVRVTVQGEVTQMQERGSAVYFTLSDSKQKATLSALIWRDKLYKSGVTLAVGQEFSCVGASNIYKPIGRMSFLVEQLRPVGEGALQQAFEKLKKQLESEGYFASQRKRPLPLYPERVVVLSSAQGDAIRDFRTHLGNYVTQLELIDVRVEGVNAIPSIVQALDAVYARADRPDVIVLTRGGGSLESLQAFNSREVAEAIFRSPVPVVSAIGHERDVSIADMVADLRASTPTDAGKILSREWSRAAEHIGQVQQAIVWRLGALVQQKRERIDVLPQRWIQRLQARIQYQRATLNHSALLGKTVRQRFVQHLDRRTQRLTQWEQRWQSLLGDRRLQTEAYGSSIVNRFRQHLQQQQRAVQVQEQFFQAVSPERRLAQGYVWLTSEDGKILRSVQNVQPGDAFSVTMTDGTVTASVKNINSKNKQESDRKKES